MASRTTDRSRHEIQQALLDSAAGLLQKEGLENFSLQRISEKADTSKQMIYTIFGSKADLIKAVYDEQIEKFIDELRDVEGDDPVHSLLKYSLAYRDWILEHKSLFDLMMSLSFQRQFRGREPGVVERNDLFDFFDDAVREAQDEELIDESVDVESLTDSLWAAANGCLRLEVVDYYSVPETAKQQYVDTTAGVLWGRGVVLPNIEEYY
jgi:AcrR family transcriptional regulator